MTFFLLGNPLVTHLYIDFPPFFLDFKTPNEGNFEDMNTCLVGAPEKIISSIGAKVFLLVPKVELPKETTDLIACFPYSDHSNQ